MKKGGNSHSQFFRLFWEICCIFVIPLHSILSLSQSNMTPTHLINKANAWEKKKHSAFIIVHRGTIFQFSLQLDLLPIYVYHDPWTVLWLDEKLVNPTTVHCEQRFWYENYSQFFLAGWKSKNETLDKFCISSTAVITVFPRIVSSLQ